MATTIAVSEETRKRLMRLKLEEETRSMDELLQKMLAAYKTAKFRSAQDMVRRRMKAKGLTLEDITGKDTIE